MPLIECKLGAATTPVGGQVYNFERDLAGRYVAMVYNDKHVECFLGAGTYREVDPLPAGYQPGQAAPAPREVTPPAPSKAMLLSGTALLTALNEATSPRMFNHEGKPYVAEAWPQRIAVTLEQLPAMAAMVFDDIPLVVATAENAQIRISVANGAATYDLLGATDMEGLYALGANTFEQPPEVPDDEDDEEDDEEEDGGDGGADTTTTTETTPAPAATPETAPAPAPVVTPPPPPPVVVPLAAVKGIGRAILKKLEAKSITTLAELLALDEAARTALNDEFNGAPTRDKWFEQAVELSKEK